MKKLCSIYNSDHLKHLVIAIIPTCYSVPRIMLNACKHLKTLWWKKREIACHERFLFFSPTLISFWSIRRKTVTTVSNAAQSLRKKGEKFYCDNLNALS